MEEILLRADNVEKTFAGNGGDLEALAPVSLSVRRGEFVCLLGPSGCGKSTLLSILGGLLPPTRGCVYLAGEPLYSGGKASFASQRCVAYVFQKANLMPWRTALGNVMLPLEISRVPRRQAEPLARDMLRLVGLEEFADSYPRKLSGGMEQRVAIARALVQGADLLLLDEPFGSLDALTREQMNEELLRIWRTQGKTVIMVTHSIAEAIYLSDRILALTSRPGHVSLEAPVCLPRPRSWDGPISPEHARLALKLREAIRNG